MKINRTWKEFKEWVYAIDVCFNEENSMLAVLVKKEQLEKRLAAAEELINIVKNSFTTCACFTLGRNHCFKCLYNESYKKENNE